MLLAVGRTHRRDSRKRATHGRERTGGRLMTSHEGHRGLMGAWEPGGVQLWTQGVSAARDAE